MIELLIIFVLIKRDRTMYSIRKEIHDLFGIFTKPSDGTIHPALERLLEKKALNVQEKMSEGGKKSTYYSINKQSISYAKELLLSNDTENPSMFLPQLQAKLSTLSLFDKETINTFISQNLEKIELLEAEIKNTLENPYRMLDKYQTNLYNENLKRLKGLENLMLEYRQ